MKKWALPVIIAIVALLMPMSSAMVNAQDGAGLSISKSANPVSAAVGDNVTYTYTITNSDNVTITGITLEDDLLGAINLGGQTSLNAGDTVTATATYIVSESDLPGPLVNTATVSGVDPDGNAVTANATATVELSGTASLQVTKSADKASAAPHQTITYTYTITNNGNITINDLALTDDKLGTISLSDSTLAPGESITATASYTVTISDLPGPIINKATVTGTGSTGQSISVNGDPVSVSLSINRWLLFKAEILKLMGVPGKGIEKAPGLQKPFNPKSQAAEHAGKKDKNQDQDQEEELLRIRERVENQGTEEQLQIREEVQNQSGSGQVTQDNDEAKPEKGQLKKNWGTDNQTVEQEATDNGHKPDKDKPNNKSKAGK